MTAIKAAAKFSSNRGSNAIRRSSPASRARTHDEPTRTLSLSSLLLLFVIVCRVSLGASLAATFIHVTMEQCQRSVERRNIVDKINAACWK